MNQELLEKEKNLIAEKAYKKAYDSARVEFTALSTTFNEDEELVWTTMNGTTYKASYNVMRKLCRKIWARNLNTCILWGAIF